MTITIVQVINSTHLTLRYHNLESGHKINVDPATPQHHQNSWIPCSNYYEDTVPFRSSNHINIRFSESTDGSPVEISDDNWRGCFRGIDAYSRQMKEERTINPLVNKGRYVLWVHEYGYKERPVEEVGAFEYDFWLVDYKDIFEVTTGYITRKQLAGGWSANGPAKFYTPDLWEPDWSKGSAVRKVSE